MPGRQTDLARAEALYLAKLQKSFALVEVVPRDGDCLVRNAAIFAALVRALITGDAGDLVAELLAAAMKVPSPGASMLRAQIVRALRKRAADPNDDMAQRIDSAVAEVVDRRAVVDGTTVRLQQRLADAIAVAGTSGLTPCAMRELYLEVMGEPGTFLELEALQALPPIVDSSVDLYHVGDIIPALLKGMAALPVPSRRFSTGNAPSSGPHSLVPDLRMQIYLSMNERHFYLMLPRSSPLAHLLSEVQQRMKPRLHPQPSASPRQGAQGGAQSLSSAPSSGQGAQSLCL